jgi:hypothetical protein
MSTGTIKYVQPNSYISTINTKMAEISRKMSGNITSVDQNKIDDIMGKLTDNEHIADSYFQNDLTQLESRY